MADACKISLEIVERIWTVEVYQVLTANTNVGQDDVEDVTQEEETELDVQCINGKKKQPFFSPIFMQVYSVGHFHHYRRFYRESASTVLMKKSSVALAVNNFQCRINAPPLESQSKRPETSTKMWMLMERGSTIVMDNAAYESTARRKNRHSMMAEINNWLQKRNIPLLIIFGRSYFISLLLPQNTATGLCSSYQSSRMGV